MRLPTERYELGSTVHMLRKHVVAPISTGAMFLLFGCVYLWTTTPLYEARITVIPRAQVQDLPGGNLVGGLGLSLLGGFRGASELSPYDKLIAILGSDEVAQSFMQNEELLAALFPEQWDRESHVWRQPEGLRAELRSLVNRIFGLPAPKVVGTEPIESYLSRRLQVVRNEIEGSHTLLLRHPTAEIARHVLDSVLNSADALLRERDRRTNLENVAFLRERLGQEPMVEVREVLSRRLGEEYVTSSLLANKSSYSYEVLRQLSVSTRPVTPQPILTLVISVFGGVVVGAALVLLLAMPGAHKRQ